MTRYELSFEAPPGWDLACADDRRLFHSSGWQRLLQESFSSSSVYAWDADTGSGAAFSIFGAGPFNVGYLGFPVGSFLGPQGNYKDLMRSWKDQDAIPAPVCIRIPVNSLATLPDLDLPATLTPETAIVDLSAWNLQSTSSNIRRDLKKAGRAGLVCADAGDCDAAETVYRLYEATIQRKQGSLRYTLAYFKNLVRLSRSREDLRVIVTLKDGKIVAFNTAALDGTIGYYLHGGIDLCARDDRPGALLMYEAIRWARESGCESFNMLPSPVGQESLVQYKEKWGGTTREHHTYTQALRPTYPLFRLAEWLYRTLS